ncbi:MAG: kelch repeat-containing protein [Spirochaetota bacterium]
MNMKKALALTVIVYACFAQAESGMRRFGIFAGASRGGTLPELIYPLSDAKSLSEVFVTLGGFDERDTTVLANPTLADLRNDIAALKAKVAAAKKEKFRVEMIFYYSGHSDKTGLLLGDEVYRYEDLKKDTEGIAADMRILILDSCMSGTLTTLKGSSARPPFLFDSTIDMEGYAFLTSSRSTEYSQESDTLGGSFFTHALISGLRGAADTVADGRVTLDELRQFASQETRKKTEHTTGGVQHPSYSMRVKGSGDVVMTALGKLSSSISLADNVAGHAYVRGENSRLIAEMTKQEGKAMTIAVPDGKYVITLEKDGRWYEARSEVSKAKASTLGRNAFRQIRVRTAAAKGGPAVYRVAVLDFVSKGNAARADANVITELFRTELVNGKRYDVLDRNNMDMILKEQEFVKSGCTENTCAVQIGKILNVDYMFFGNLMKMGNLYYVSAGIIDVETSRIVKSERVSMKSLDESTTVLADLLKRLAVDAESTTAVAAVQPAWAAARENAPFSARSGFTALAWNGRIWLFGGYEPATKKTLRDVWSTSDGTNWQLANRKANFWDRNRHASAVFNSALWIVGGFQANSGGFNGSMNDVWRSTDGTNWSQFMRSTGFTVREGHTLVPFKNALWVIGGFAFRENVNDVIRSDSGSNWLTVNSNAPFSARNEHTSFVLGDSLYIAGGIGEDGNAMNDIWKTRDGKQWTRGTGPFSPRFGARTVVIGTAVYLIGGCDGKNGMNDIWRSVDGVTWTAEAAPPFTGRFLHEAVAFNGSIWVIGGVTDDSYEEALNDVWSLSK